MCLQKSNKVGSIAPVDTKRIFNATELKSSSSSRATIVNVILLLIYQLLLGASLVAPIASYMQSPKVWVVISSTTNVDKGLLAAITVRFGFLYTGLSIVPALDFMMRL